MEDIFGEDFLLTSEEGDKVSANDDLKQLLQDANIKAALLEDQLSLAHTEIKFLREQLSSTQLDLIKSRSEVKVLLEELTACKTDNLEAEQFPNLLLSSLDKLFEDKQQQLWLISGIQTSIDKLDSKMEKEKEMNSSTSYSELEVEVPTKKVAVKKSPEEVLMPKLSKFYINDRNKSSGQNGKKDGMALHLELKKAYDFSPSSSDIPNKRSYPTPTPSSLYANRNTFWTPTTPTPSHALRPSLSLHNLESKVFTEVLIPTIRPPARHEVSPQEPSPRTPRAVRISPSQSSPASPASAPPGCFNVRRTFPGQTVPTVISPPRGNKKKSPSSPHAQPFKSLAGLGRLSEISENVILMKCS